MVKSKGESHLSLADSLIFQSKSLAIFRIFSFGSTIKSLDACFASANAYLFLIKEFSVAITIKSAMERRGFQCLDFLGF